MILYFSFKCGCSSTARIPAFQAGCVGSIPITRSKREVVPLGMTSLFLYQWESNFVRSRRAIADRCASFFSLYRPPDALATSPITRSKKALTFMVGAFYFVATISFHYLLEIFI